MAGKKGASGRIPESGFMVLLNIRIDPNLVSSETIEFLRELEQEKSTTQRGILLDQKLKAGLAPKEAKPETNNFKNEALAMLRRR